MIFLDNVINNFTSSFSFGNLIATITDASNWMIIFSLVIMEGFLSADNALVLAMMVRHLPKGQQKKALRYGIWGAYAFRLLAIGIGVYLIKIWWVKLIAAGYLLKLSADYFFINSKNEKDYTAQIAHRGFWGTILMVELMDMAFSIDSITAAFGISEQMWVLFLGAVFGILMMRGVAQLFVRLIARVPYLESGAYLLIAVIGVKMIAELFQIKLPEYVFFGLLVSIFGGVLVVHKWKNKGRRY